MIFETIIQDLRVGFRVLIKEKSFCALATLVLALGICAVTTMFSIINGAMIRGFASPGGDRLAGVQVIDITDRTTNQNGFGGQIFTLDLEAMLERQQSFEMLAGYINGSTVNLTIDGRAQRNRGAYVTPDFFRMLSVKPALGRDFTAGEHRAGAPKVALISHTLWQRDFGGGRDVLGRSVRINGKPATVVGVMPSGFAFPGTEEIWIPLYSEFPPVPRNDPRINGNQVAVIGLLKPGVSFEAATAEFTGIVAQLAQAFPDTNKKFDHAQVAPLIKAFVPPNVQGLLWTMMSFCIGILLIACVNVMNMQFARAALRGKELAVRSSLGASRGRLIRQMLTESFLLSAIGALLGIWLSVYATDYLNQAAHNVDNPIPAYISFDLDQRVLLTVVAATMLSAVASGFVPAWIASRANAVDALKEGGRGNTSRAVSLITRGLVVFQIFVTCILLVGSLLQLQAILRQNRIDFGYDNAAVFTARMGLMDGDYPTPEARKLFYDRLLRELRARPEFDGAALTNRFRMSFSGNARIEIEGRSYVTDNDRPNTNFEQITEGYFQALGRQILEGRDFALDDNDPKLPVAIVNAAFAKKHFGAESAVGRRFRTVGNNGLLFGPWRTIVSVVPTLRMLGPFTNTAVDDTGFYVPYFSSVFGPVRTEPFPQQFATVLVHPKGAGQKVALLGNALQRAVQQVDPNLPLYFVGTAKENQESFLAMNVIIATMFSVFGLVAVILASVGLYGVMSFSVNQRTQEFGIRMALGADRERILKMVLQQGGAQLALGLTLGLGLAGLIGLLGRQAIRDSGQIFDVSPTDPLTYLAVATLLTVVALIATMMPARRATRVDPMVALRAE
jgi:putative ABC transport system permease protein